MPRGRVPKEDRGKVRRVRIEIMVTEAEKASLDRWAEEDGCDNRSQWMREQCGLSADPQSTKLKWEEKAPKKSKPKKAKTRPRGEPEL